LDVFGDICGLMDEFANQLDEDKKRVEDDLAVLPAVAQETSAKRFLDGLTAGTTDAEIVAACKFDEQKADRLEKLRLALAKNPQDEAKRLLRLAVRLRNLQQSVETIEKLVGGETPKVTALLNTVEVARKAVNEASALVFDDPLLDGVGSDPWRVLFDAAEKYSISEAYKGKEFPYVGDDARCVLCQQPLSHDAKGRFDKFKKFVSDAAGRALKEAEREVNTHSTKLFTHLRSIGAAEDALVDEVAEVDEPLRNALVDLRAACRKCVSEEAAGLPGPDTAALGKLLERLSSLEVTASQLDVDAEEVLKRLDADERSKRDREVSELEASKVLAANEASVVRRRDQLTVLMSNRHAKDSLRTNAVTEAGKQIAESAVTSELHESWGRALEGLGLVDPPVKMKKSTSKGSYKTSFELIGCSRKANMTDVLSEGEQRVIALAAFIAELSLADHANAVVFDDPVSSLDHNHRGCVAESIVGLAEQRQVIVFTHDLVFLKDLDNCCEKAGLTATIRGIHRESSGKVGVCRPDSCPADLLPLREHLTALEAQRLELKAKHEQSGDSPSYRTGVQDWYGSLRDAWEKAVEETLFNGVVQTYVDGVKTLSLREVAVEDRDWEDVVDGMTRCSTHLHRMSAVRNSPIPPPANLLSDLDALRAFQKRVKDRRKDLKNRRPAPPK
jgi:AAA domain